MCKGNSNEINYNYINNLIIDNNYYYRYYIEQAGKDNYRIYINTISWNDGSTNENYKGWNHKYFTKEFNASELNKYYTKDNFFWNDNSKGSTTNEYSKNIYNERCYVKDFMKKYEKEIDNHYKLSTKNLDKSVI